MRCLLFSLAIYCILMSLKPCLSNSLVHCLSNSLVHSRFQYRRHFDNGNFCALQYRAEVEHYEDISDKLQEDNQALLKKVEKLESELKKWKRNHEDKEDKVAQLESKVTQVSPISVNIVM